MKVCTGVLVILLVVSGSALAGNTGKIAGTIKDKQTGEVVVGANVIIRGTKLGASSDIDGRYFILQVPPGVYEVEFSSIAHHPFKVKDVVVQVDLTTQINASLDSKVIESPTIEIVAERKMVQKDVTSTRRTVTRETMQSTPSIESTGDVFKLQAGSFVSTAPQSIQLTGGTQLQVRDESLKDVHVRGGRGGELLYMVDGVPITHPLYGGRSVLELNMVDVEQVELLTGAFNAEYGEAQSGVVNITTRSGGERFMGGVEYRTDQVRFLGESYLTDYASVYLGGPEPITRYLLPAIGVNVPGTLGYFVSTNGTRTNTPYDNHRSREVASVLGFNVKDRQDNSLNLNAKVNWDVAGDFRVTTAYQGSWKRWSDFDWLWKNYPDSTAAFKRNTHNLTVQVNHMLSKSTFYNLSFGYLNVAYKGSLYGRSPADYWRIGKSVDGSRDSVYASLALPPVPDPLTGFYDVQGVADIWRDDLTSTYTIKGDITSQILADHLVKAGAEIRFNNLSYVDIQDGGYKLSNYGEYLYRGGPPAAAPPGPYKEFGQYRWVFKVNPIIGSAYVQDKYELEMLILNAGLRFDWFYLGKTVMQDDWKQQWQAATGLQPDWSSFKFKFSPRFGISFPISERTVIFFSYGHFTQLPELQYYYRDPYSSGVTGNPNLDYEQTILYEFGLTHQLADRWAIDVKSYTKDISKLVGSTHLRAGSGTPVDLFDNTGYARARGLEFQLTKAYSDFTSGVLTYTVQWANGYSSSAFDDYIRSLTDFPNPIRERRLGWDIRHQVIFQGTVSSPRGSPIRVFGIDLPDDWSLTVLSRFTTGQPYTPFTLDPSEAQVKENAETGPSNSMTDIKFIKTFELSPLRISFVLDIFNIFDQNNIDINWGFNTATGKPFRFGDRVAPSNQFYDWYTMYRLMDPRQLSTGRSAKVGFRVEW